MADDDVQWRQLDRYLWVGIGLSGHIGTIEQGRRFDAVDTDGRVRGRCRTLDHAKAVLETVQAAGPRAVAVARSAAA